MTDWVSVKTTNNLCQKLLGHTESELISPDFLENIHPDDKEKWQSLKNGGSQVVRISQKGRYSTFEFQSSQTGEDFIVTFRRKTSGTPTEVMGAFSSFNKMPYAIIDTHNIVRQASEPFAARIGLKLEEVIGKPFSELLYGTAFPVPDSPHFLAVSTGEPKRSSVFIERVGRAFLHHALPIMGEDGQISHTINLITEAGSAKIIEEDLIKNERTFKAILSALGDVVFKIHKYGIFIDYWTAVPDMLFTQPENFLGKTVWEVMSEQLAKTSMTALNQALETGLVQRFEYDTETPGGKRYFEARMVASGPEEVVTVCHDITLEKQYQEAMIESEGKFQAAFTESPEAMVLSTFPEGVIEDASDGFLEMFGLTRGQAIGKSSKELSLWEDLNLRDKGFENLTKDGVVNNFEASMNSTMGKRTVLISSKFITHKSKRYLSSLVRDITEFKASQDKLIESEKKFSVAFKESPQVYAILKVPGNVFLEVSEGFTELFGHMREEIIGKSVYDIGDIWIQKDFEVLKGLKFEDDAVINLETVMKSRDGREFPVQFSTRTVKVGDEWFRLAQVIDLTERRRFERAINESEMRFSVAFRESPMPYLIVTYPENRIIDVSDGFTALLGFAREEALGASSRELLWKGNEGEFDKIIGKLGKLGVSINLETTVFSKSGLEIPVLLSTRVVRIGTKMCRLTILTDLTEKRIYKHALDDSEERFKVAFRQSPEPFGIIRHKDHVFLEISEGFTRLTGVKREEIIGKNPEGILKWSNPGDWKRMLSELEKHGQVTNFESVIVNKAGEEIEALFSAKVVEISGVPCRIVQVRDITQHRSIERKLRKREHQFAVAIRQNPIPFAIMKHPEGAFVEVSDGFVAITESTRDEVIGKTPDDLKMTVKRSDWQNILEKLAMAGEVTNFETELLTKSGRMVPVLYSSKIVDIEREKYRLTTVVDITEKRRYEEALKESEERFEVAFRESPEILTLVSLDDFVIRDVSNGFLIARNQIRDDYVGRPVDIHSFGISKEEAEGLKKEVLEKGGIVNKEIQVVRSNLGLRDILLSVKIVDIKGEKHLLTVSHDVTQLKIIQKQAEGVAKFNKWMAEKILSPIAVIQGEKIIFANDAFYDIVGYGKEELQNIDLESLVPGNALDSINESVSKIGLGLEVPERHTVPFIHKSGDMRFAKISISRSTFDDKECLLVSATDITELQKTKESLEKANEFKQALINSVQDGVVANDLDGKYILFQWPALEKTGFRATNAIGKTPCEVFGRHEKTEMFEENMRKVMKTGQIDEFMMEGNMSEPVQWLRVMTSPLVSSGGKVVGTVTVIRDSTERHLAQRQVELQKMRFETIASSISDVLFEVENNLITYVSPAVVSMFGRLISDFEGHRPDEFIPKLKAARLMRSKGVSSFETKILDALDHEHVLECSVNRIGNAFFGVAHDVTTARTEQEAKQFFIGSVAHELRTPLTIILGFAELLQEHTKGDPKAKDMAEAIFEAATRENRHINKLTSFELAQWDYEHKKIDAFKLFSSIGQKVGVLLSKLSQDRYKESLVHYNYHVSDSLKGVSVNGDSSAICEIFENLAINSLKYSPKERIRITFSATNEGRHVKIVFTDKGIGMSPATTQKLFKPFFQANPTGDPLDGVGIGLATVKLHVDAHGGNIKVESIENEGTTFTVMLPTS